MARIKFGSVVVSGSGSLGGHTFQNSHGGAQLRSKPINKKKPSSAQSIIRSYNPVLQNGWQALTAFQRKSWDEYAVSYAVMNKNGDKHFLSGHSIWMKYNYHFLSNGFSLENNPAIAALSPFKPELIVNGDFEGGFVGGLANYWVHNGAGTPASCTGYSGSGFSQCISFVSAAGRVYQSVSFLVGSTYRISGYVKTNVSLSSAGIIVRRSNNAFVATIRDLVIPLNEWTYFEVDYSPTSNNIGGFIGLDSRTALTFNSFFDNMSVKEIR